MFSCFLDVASAPRHDLRPVDLMGIVFPIKRRMVAALLCGIGTVINQALQLFRPDAQLVLSASIVNHYDAEVAITGGVPAALVFQDPR